MKKIVLMAIISLICFVQVDAQDVADVGVASRFARSKTIYVSGGIGKVLGKTLGDYSVGTSFETGFMKRLNKVMSIGAGVSYLAFKYDAAKTYPYYYIVDDDYAVELELAGGDVSLISAGFNFKLNLIPVSDNTVFSVYGIGTPFISYSSRTDVAGTSFFYTNNGSGVYDDPAGSGTWDKESFPALGSESKVTGGVYLGFGMELFPAKAVSIFAQATYGYTLPITYVSSGSYLHEEDQYTDANDRVYYGDTSSAKISYFNDEFPIIKKGFSAVSIKFGVAFNF